MGRRRGRRTTGFHRRFALKAQGPGGESGALYSVPCEGRMEAVQGVRGHRTLLSVAPQAGVRVTCPMKRSGSDYWKLYHDDFFDDERVLPLSAAEVGIYLWLLGLQAKHGSLPGSDAALAAMGRRWGRDWGKAWPKLAKFFPINDSGNRENPRQAFELSEVDASRSKETGRKARWRKLQKELSTGTSAGQGRGQDGDGDALSRTRGEERREDETRREETRGEETDGQSPSLSRAQRAEPKPRVSAEPSNSATRLISDFWCDRFLKIRGAKYVWQGGKDGALLARLLKATGGDVAEIQRRAERFLTDPFWSEKADWSKFCSQYNAMAGNGKPVEDEFEKAARMLGVGRPS